MQRGGDTLFSELVIGYLFLGGTGAGACFILALMGLFVPRDRLEVLTLKGDEHSQRAILRVPKSYRLLFAAGYVAALVVLILGVICLALDLWHLDRIILFAVSPTTSYVTIGAYALFACILVSAALLLIWSGISNRSGIWPLRILEILMLAIALVVMLYTGLLLGSMRSVPLWSNPWLPLLFVFSSVSCGAALVLAVAQLTGAHRMFAKALTNLVSIDAVIIVLEIVVVALFVIASARGVGVATFLGQDPSVAFEIGVALPGAHDSLAELTNTDLAALISLRDLLAGDNAWLFWGGFVIVGLAAPLVGDIVIARVGVDAVVGGKMTSAPLVLAVCVLAGGCIMRYCIVEAGIHPALNAVGVM